MRETVYRCDSCDARLTSGSNGVTIMFAEEVSGLTMAGWSDTSIHVCTECRPEWLEE